ncbi:MAG TPA: tRNA (N6-threonylcarbamoyladenosine(37)-N6)-methyltransferase TrmO [Treponema sp.]|nr:tRNA (N6-threonylcarbamoyladenosine(37)-N6)-methyltransferase TrmO [Treponema sp.]
MTVDEINLREIGIVENDGRKFSIKLHKKYVPGLMELKGFSHLLIIWCFHKSENNMLKDELVLKSPYKKGPEQIGVFATRSPDRPNPLAISAPQVKSINFEKGIIDLWWIDADSGTPVLDIKPYEPCLDRVAQPEVPDWCKHWPGSIEESGNFDWENEFNF